MLNPSDVIASYGEDAILSLDFASDQPSFELYGPALVCYKAMDLS